MNRVLLFRIGTLSFYNLFTATKHSTKRIHYTLTGAFHTFAVTEWKGTSCGVFFSTPLNFASSSLSEGPMPQGHPTSQRACGHGEFSNCFLAPPSLKHSQHFPKTAVSVHTCNQRVRPVLHPHLPFSLCIEGISHPSCWIWVWSTVFKNPEI